MPRSCSVCVHPDAKSINEFLVLKRLSNRKAASLCDVSEAAIRRHREHIPELLARAARAEELVEADRLLDRILEHLERGYALEQKAADTGELTHEIRAHGSVRGDLVLLGEVLGKLDRVANVSLVMNNPTWIALEALIVQALEDHPDARTDVLRALEGVEKDS